MRLRIFKRGNVRPSVGPSVDSSIPLRHSPPPFIGQRGGGDHRGRLRRVLRRLSLGAHSDAVGEFDHGHFGFFSFGHRTAHRKAAAKETLRQRKTHHIQSHDEGGGGGVKCGVWGLDAQQRAFVCERLRVRLTSNHV